MERIKFRALGILDRIRYEDAHRNYLRERIDHLKTARRNREAFRNTFTLSGIGIDKTVIRRHQNVGNLIASHIDNERIAMETVNRGPTVNRHREAIDRDANTVKRIDQVIAKEHNFRIAVAIDIAKRHAGLLVLETTCSTRTALVIADPFCRQLAFAKLDTCYSTARTQHDSLDSSVAIQVCTSHTERFIPNSGNLRIALLLAETRLCTGIVFESKLAHKDLTFFTDNDAKEFILANFAKRHILRVQKISRRGKRTSHFIRQVHGPESGIRSKEQVRICNNRPSRSRLQFHHVLHRDARVQGCADQLVLVQRVDAIAIASKPDKRTEALSQTIQRNLLRQLFLGKVLLRDHRIRHEKRIAKGVHRLKRTIFRGKHNRLARLVIFVIDKYRTAHSSFKACVFRELRIFDAAVINANRHANDRRCKVDNAIAHECICSLFDTSVFRNLYRNLDSSVTTLRCRRIGIACRRNGRHGIRRFLGL